jgi:outer membrane protein
VPLLRTAQTLTGLLVVSLITALPADVSPQSMLTLEEAMTRARSRSPDARVFAAAAAEASAHVVEAQARYLPRVDVAHSVQRSDHPVFVFSSLLSQRKFTADNFDIAALNEPAPLTNVRTAVTVEQHIFDAGRTRLGVHAARLGHEIAVLDRTRGGQDLALAAAQSFVRVLQFEATERAATAAEAAAQSDLERVRARRDVGMVTEADVLAVEVYLADMRQRRIGAAGEAAVARLELNDAMGDSLDQQVVLVRPQMRSAASDGGALAEEAGRVRPDRQEADLRVRLAANARRTAQAAFLPTVGIQGGWESNGDTWASQRSGWLLGAQLQLNVFNGFADRARVAQARQAESRAVAERDGLARRIEVDVRSALTRLEAARASETTGRAALAQARESQRILRDRYDSGLATVTDVLRTAVAVLDAESRATTAEMEVILQTVALDRALGRL